MEKFEIKIPISNPGERGDKSVENETPTVLNIESITVPALKKNFRYSENTRKETSIEGYERIKITWGVLYGYLKDFIVEMPIATNEDDKRELIIKLSGVVRIDTQFKDEDKSFTDYQGVYHEVYLNSLKELVAVSLGRIAEYSQITDANVTARLTVKKLKELNDNLQKESDELLELRALCSKREELHRIKTFSEESYVELKLVVSRIRELVKILPERDTLKRIDSCVKSLSGIIKPITEKVHDALLLLLSTWSNGEFPKLTFNHVLSADVGSPEEQQRHRERLFKDDIFLQQIGIDGDPRDGSQFDLADGYLWEARPFITEPSFGFAPDDVTFINIIKSIGLPGAGRSVDFILDPNVKQWLSQVNNPGHSKESGYKNWFKFKGHEKRESTKGHPSLSIPANPKHTLRWGHAKYAIIPTEKNLNLIKLEHRGEE